MSVTFKRTTGKTTLYAVHPDGTVEMTQDESGSGSPPGIHPAIAFWDANEHMLFGPVQPMDVALIEEMKSLVEGVEIDLNAPLPEEVSDAADE